MSGKAGRSGRRKGATKAFVTDPDRHVIFLADGLVALGKPLEHAVMFSIYFHQRARIPLPKNPLDEVRRLRLAQNVQQCLRAGWVLQQWGPEITPSRDMIGGQVDRIRKKMRRAEHDEQARRRPHYMRMAWVSILRAPNLGVVQHCIAQAGETDYFVRVVLPYIKELADKPVDDPPL